MYYNYERKGDAESVVKPQKSKYKCLGSNVNEGPITEKGLSFIHQICIQYISMKKFLETSHFNSISTIIRRGLNKIYKVGNENRFLIFVISLTAKKIKDFSSIFI